MNKQLQNKLLRMQARDQKMRRSGRWETGVDRKNTILLKKIIEKYGWPDVYLVGERGSNAAWLIAQHADHNPSFQRRCLKLMSNPKISTYVSPIHIAYLTDRVRVNAGRRQVYGTQFYGKKDGRIVPRPIQDKRNLDKRREHMGLELFGRY